MDFWKAHFEHVTCFSDEKIFRIDAVAPGRSFHTFYRGKQGRRNNATLPFRDTPCEKGRVALLRRPILSHFSRHIPPRSGLPLHGQCSPRCCVARSLTRFVAKRLHFVGILSAVQGASAWHPVLSQHIAMRCVISFHG